MSKRKHQSGLTMITWIVLIGMVGFMCRRNLIVMFLCTELMFQGVAINLIAFGRYHGNFGKETSVIVDYPFITGRSTPDSYLTGPKVVEVLEDGLRRYGW